MESTKQGGVKKCPSCGASVEAFQTKCSECGFEFTGVESVGSAQKLFALLQDVELRKSEEISKHNQEKQRRLDELSTRHNNDSTLVKMTETLAGTFSGPFSGRHNVKDEEREDLIRELNKDLQNIERKYATEKSNVIRSFPVPNAREDLLELLAMATSNAYDNDGVIGMEEEVWIQKSDQIYQKIIICSSDDQRTLEQATNMIVSLMKRLPKSYKNFTVIPKEMRTRVQQDLEAEKNERKEHLIKCIKKRLIWAAPCLGIGLILLIIGCSLSNTACLLIGIVCLVPLFWAYKGIKKEYENPFDI